MPGAVRGWRMPLWPFGPILIIAAVGYALFGSALRDVLITGSIVVVAALYYAYYLRKDPASRFVVEGFDA